MSIDPLGDSAVLVRLNDSLERVLAAREALQSANLPGVIEVAPAYVTLGVFYDPTQIGFELLAQRITDMLASEAKANAVPASKLIEIPVSYGGEFGPDLDDVAVHTGLTSDEVIARHSAAEYVVSCVGFTPGFPYLSGLPNELSTPRRATPRTQVPAGSVAIGGSQTGIYPTQSPGGWNLIGRTTVPLFDPQRDPPALLQAGDRVRFVPAQ